MIVVVMVGLGVLAAVLTQGTSIFGVAVVNAAATFWSNGVMWNFRHDPVSPRWAVVVTMLTPVVSLLLIAGSFAMK
jgi:hypothetical protein